MVAWGNLENRSGPQLVGSTVATPCPLCPGNVDRGFTCGWVQFRVGQQAQLDCSQPACPERGSEPGEWEFVKVVL